MRRKQHKIREKGLAAGDPFLGFVKGYDRLEAAARSTMELSMEVESIRNVLFPLRDVPVPDRPGYVTHEHNYFSIESKSNRIKKKKKI